MHFGVLVQPYRVSGKKVRAMTTGDVAKILEDKYGVMAAFYKVHGADVVVPAMEVSLGGAMESLMMGRPVNPWDRGAQMIQAGFRDFISSREAERVGIPGTPTKAALAGVNHRLKHPYRRRNASRPSFRDTGLYMNSMRVWVEKVGV
jgi:hypothetical protein